MALRASPSSRDEIVAALYRLFRCAGYEGVSLSDISAATGLGKSSLYHHFPNGKSDMADAVGVYALKAMRAGIFDPLGAEAPLPKKIAAMLAAVDRMYEGGAAPCLVAAMLPSGAAAGPIRAILSEWIDALAVALKKSGAKPAEARARAVEAIAAIEGALIVAQATGDLTIFAKALKRAKTDLSAA